MKNWLKKNLFLLLLFIVLPVFVGSVKAATLNFDQATVTTTNGGTFQIAVTLTPGSDSITSVDAYVTYDSTLLKPTTVTAGTLFPTVTNDITTAGKVYIAGLVNDASSAVSTSGTVATITFQGLQNGTATLAYDCNTSKIIKNDINASNVIVCGSDGTSTVTIGSGSGSSSSSGSNPAATPTSAPTQLPKSGSFDNLMKLGIYGTVLLLLGGAMRMIL